MTTKRLQPRRCRRLARTTIALVLCAALAGTADVASAAGGHLPGFSALNRRVAISKLPGLLRLSFGGVPGVKGTGFTHVGHGPVWFGEVERPNGTFYAAGNGRWVCAGEVRDAKGAGESSHCESPGSARDLGLLSVSSCGKGKPRHFRIVYLVPDGVTALEIEKSGGEIGRTVPVIDNTVAFTVGRQNMVLRGVGEAATGAIYRVLPLAQAAKESGSFGGSGCSSFDFFETREGK